MSNLFPHNGYISSDPQGSRAKSVKHRFKVWSHDACKQLTLEEYAIELELFSLSMTTSCRLKTHFEQEDGRRRKRCMWYLNYRCSRHLTQATEHAPYSLAHWNASFLTSITTPEVEVTIDNISVHDFQASARRPRV